MVIKAYKTNPRLDITEPVETVRVFGATVKKRKIKKTVHIMQMYLDELITTLGKRPLFVGDLYIAYQRYTYGVRNPIKKPPSLATHPDYPLSDNRMFSFLAKGRFILMYDVARYWIKHPALREEVPPHLLRRGAYGHLEARALPSDPEDAYKRASVMEFYRIWWATLRDIGRWDIIRQQNNTMLRHLFRRHPFSLYIDYLADVDDPTDIVERYDQRAAELGIPHLLVPAWRSLALWVTTSYQKAQLPWVYRLDKEAMRYIYPPSVVPDDIIIQTLYRHIHSPLIPKKE